MQRNEFIKKVGLAGSGLALAHLIPTALSAAEKEFTPLEKKLIILHTNDVHSRIDPFPKDGSQYSGLGGIARRAELIKEIRKQGLPTLTVDAGDIFQGTPYFNIYKGEPEIRAMNLMQYDAATIGNHDFDAGIENLATQIDIANFSFVNCNYDFSNTPLENKVAPYKIMYKGNVKIGITGVGIELANLVTTELYGNVVYKNPIESVNKVAERLKKEGCDIIICLSHLGDKYPDKKISDEIMAQNTHYIDLIIGGHTHVFFKEPRSYTNLKGGNTIVNQVGWAGIELGRLDFELSDKEPKKIQTLHKILVQPKQ